MTPRLEGSQFNMENLLNLDQSPLNLDPAGQNSMGAKFNATPAEETCNFHASHVNVISRKANHGSHNKFMFIGI